MVLDRHVLALDVAGFTKPLAERGHIAREASADPASDEPDHRDFAACCARAATGHAAALPRSDIKSRRLIAAPTFRIGHRTG